MKVLNKEKKSFQIEVYHDKEKRAFSNNEIRGQECACVEDVEGIGESTPKYL